MEREDVDRAIRASEVLSAIIDGCRSELVDFAETQLRNAIAKGEDWAIRYVLDSFRASPRGWRKAATAPPQSSPSASGSDDLRNLTDAQLEQMNRSLLEE